MDISKLNQITTNSNVLKEAIENCSELMFTIKEVNADSVTIAFKPTDYPTPKSKEEIKHLLKLTKNLFSPFVENRTIHIRPIINKSFSKYIVTSQWIQAQMKEKDISSKKIARDTGVAKDVINGYKVGSKSMTNTVKAMFYYYFKSLE